MTCWKGNGQARDPDLRAARRNVYLLTAAQGVLGTLGPITFAVGGVAGYQLLGDDKSLATAPLTGSTSALRSVRCWLPLFPAFWEGRPLSSSARFLGACGGAVAAIALFRQDFWIFALGLCIAGMSGGFAQKIRFAAADASPSFYKPRAISWILAGGMISAVLGPQLVS